MMSALSLLLNSRFLKKLIVMPTNNGLIMKVTAGALQFLYDCLKVNLQFPISFLFKYYSKCYLEVFVLDINIYI